MKAAAIAARCGFACSGDLDDVSECNCSICTMKGILHLVVPRERFELLRGRTNHHLQVWQRRREAHLLRSLRHSFVLYAAFGAGWRQCQCSLPGRCGRRTVGPRLFDGRTGKTRCVPSRGMRRSRSDFTGFAVIRSISCSSSGVSAQPAAQIFASTCSGFVAPAMMLETHGRAASQLIARSNSVLPYGSRMPPAVRRPASCHR